MHFSFIFQTYIHLNVETISHLIFKLLLLVLVFDKTHIK